MKSLTITILIIISYFTSFSQTITPELESPFSFQTKEGVAICGLTKDDYFKATIYDKNLKPIKEYSKETPGSKVLEYEIKGDRIEIRTLNGGFKREGSYIILTTDLEEIASGTYTKDDYKKALDLMEKKNKNEYIRATPIAGFEDAGYGFECGYYKDDLFQLHYTQSLKIPFAITFGMKQFNYSGPTVLRRYGISETGAWTIYQMKWEAIIDIADVKEYKIIFVDDNQIILCINKKEKKNDFGIDYIYCVDSKTGNVIYKKELITPETKINVHFSKGFYDASAKKLLIGGNYFNLNEKKDKDRYKGMGFMLLDEKGDVVKAPMLAFPEYNLDEYRGYNFKKKSITIDSISKNNNNYRINISLRAHYVQSSSSVSYSGAAAPSSSGPQRTTEFHTNASEAIIGFHLLELDNNLIDVSRKSHFITEYKKKNIVFMRVIDNGNKIIYWEKDSPYGGKDVNTIHLINDFNKLSSVELFSFKSRYAYGLNQNRIEPIYYLNSGELLLFKKLDSPHTLTVTKL